MQKNNKVFTTIQLKIKPQIRKARKEFYMP